MNSNLKIYQIKTITMFKKSTNFRNLAQLYQFRRCSQKISENKTCEKPVENPQSQINPTILKKFQVFRDEEAVILDIEEERQMFELQSTVAEVHRSVYEELNLERGISGVFEIEDLVEILKKDNAVDIFVCKVPKELKYVDYMCIISGNSYRHMMGMANFVRKVYKLKRHRTDIIPKIEGETCKNWMAMDLGWIENQTLASCFIEFI